MDKEYSLIIIQIKYVETGQMTYGMEMEYKHMKTVTNMKENGRMIKRMVLD